MMFSFSFCVCSPWSNVLFPISLGKSGLSVGVLLPAPLLRFQAGQALTLAEHGSLFHLGGKCLARGMEIITRATSG